MVDPLSSSPHHNPQTLINQFSPIFRFSSAYFSPSIFFTSLSVHHFFCLSSLFVRSPSVQENKGIENFEKSSCGES
ncbi:unnamed protein product [Trifolium pratense]|uniref:Uncharacterized protein n=1 Tax=Trifolium pratense TaxID=57577 RepID=A0ACB0JIE6_TRIPR|nr:unnamed protein product [Trifolium pratense]